MFCVECGEEHPLEALRGGTCPRCYLEKNVLASVRGHVDVEVCVHCHARRRGEQWLEGHAALEPVVQDAVREAIVFAKVVERPRISIEVEPEDARNFRVRAVASGVAEGVPFDTPLTARSRVKNATCLRCSRIQGGYYEAIVQVRATNRDLDPSEMRAVRQLGSRFIDRVVQEGDRNAFVLRDLEEHGGLDIYMGTTNSGRMLAKTVATEFGGKVTEHAKTVGQKDGLDLVRMTFAVRFPEYRAGDLVHTRDGLQVVGRVGVKIVVLHDLRTGQVRHVERGDLEKAQVLKRADAKQAVVVSRSATELQVLDPWTYATVSVLRPKVGGELPLGDSVDVLKHDDELIVLPPKNDS